MKKLALMGTHCFRVELYFLLFPTVLLLKHKKKYDRYMLCRIQKVAVSPLSQSTLRTFPLQSFSTHVPHVFTHLLPLPPAGFFFNDCSFWFRCLRFYCLKLEQMVLCLLNTKLCHAGIIISAELAPCKSGFIL